MKCRHCGQPIDDDSTFCPFCGEMQKGAPVTETPESSDPQSIEEEKPSGDVAAEDKELETMMDVDESPLETGAGVPFADVSDSNDAFSRRSIPQERTAKPNRGGEFVSGWLTLIILGALFIAMIVFGGLSKYLFTGPYLLALLQTFIPIAMIAMAAAITTRAKGPDLSVGAVVPLGAMIFVVAAAFSASPAVSLIAGLLACLVVGIVNGVLVVVLRIPALIATILAAAAVSGIKLIFAWANTYELAMGTVTFDTLVVSLIVAAGVVIVCFLLVLLTKLGKPMDERGEEDARRPSYFVAYVLSALIAGVAGLMILMQTGTAPQPIGGGYMVVVLLFFGILISNRRADNRFFPIIFTLFAAVVYTMMIDIFALYLLPALVKPLAEAGLAILFVILAFATRKSLVRGMAMSS